MKIIEMRDHFLIKVERINSDIEENTPLFHQTIDIPMNVDSETFLKNSLNILNERIRIEIYRQEINTCS